MQKMDESYAALKREQAHHAETEQWQTVVVVCMVVNRQARLKKIKTV